MITISIIIVNYKVKEFIIPCIESIYKNKPKNYSFELIVVDNNSNDGSIEAISEKFTHVIIIENKKNVGFSSAVNQGAKKAEGNFLFVLNPDSLFLEDSLSKLMLFINKQNNTGVIGPSLVSKAGKIQQSFWRFPTLINTLISIYNIDFFNYKKNYANKGKNKILKVDSISGGAFLISSKLFKSLNGLNENLFWMEDIDLCYRIKKLGYDNYFFAETKIIHFQGKSAEKNWTLAISNQLISKIKYFKLHHSSFEGIILKNAILLLSIIKAFLLLLISPYKIKYKNKLSGHLIVIGSIIKKN